MRIKTVSNEKLLNASIGTYSKIETSIDEKYIRFDEGTWMIISEYALYTLDSDHQKDLEKQYQPFIMSHSH